MDDNEVPTLEQRIQDVAGRHLGLNVWVGALIAVNPEKARLQAVVDQLAAMTEEMLLLQSALQSDDGLRASYSAVMRAMQDLMRS